MVVGFRELFMFLKQVTQSAGAEPEPSEKGGGGDNLPPFLFYSFFRELLNLRDKVKGGAEGAVRSNHR